MFDIRILLVNLLDCLHYWSLVVILMSNNWKQTFALHPGEKCSEWAVVYFPETRHCACVSLSSPAPQCADFSLVCASHLLVSAGSSRGSAPCSQHLVAQGTVVLAAQLILHPLLQVSNRKQLKSGEKMLWFICSSLLILIYSLFLVFYRA